MESNNLVKQLSTIQRELKAPKSQFNNFGKYKYRNCEDILEALKPLLGDLAVTISDEIKVIGDRVYVNAVATITNGTESISTTAYAREALTKKGMDDSQITGAASSYARKYALNGLFLIDDTKDADSRDNSPGVVLDDIAKSWIMAVKKDPDAINQIEDLEYRKFIEANIK